MFVLKSTSDHITTDALDEPDARHANHRPGRRADNTVRDGASSRSSPGELPEAWLAFREVRAIHNVRRGSSLAAARRAWIACVVRPKRSSAVA